MRVLSVTHGPTVGGGVFDEAAERGGHRLERWVVPVGTHHAAPEDYDAIMVFGGGMHPDADAEHGWLAGETAFLAAALAARVPLLGVCLGAQLIVRAAGAWTGPAEQAELGWHDVELTTAGRGDPVLGALPPRFEAFQWHRYTYAVPDGGVELATSPAATQAYRIGRHAWGVQFHPEVTHAMAEAWIADEEELGSRVTALTAETRVKIGPWNELGRRLCGAFLAQSSRT